MIHDAHESRINRNLRSHIDNNIMIATTYE